MGKKKEFSQKLLAGLLISAVSFEQQPKKNTIFQHLLNFKISFYAAISPLGIYPREIKALVHKGM